MHWLLFGLPQRARLRDLDPPLTSPNPMSPRKYVNGLLIAVGMGEYRVHPCIARAFVALAPALLNHLRKSHIGCK